MTAVFLLLLGAFTDVRIDAATPAAARALARERLSVYRVDGSSAFAVAPEDTITALRLRGFVVTKIAASPARNAGYRTPAEINAAIEALADGVFVKLERLGVSRRGTPVLGLRIGDPTLPSVRVLGGHHGDEMPSVEVPLRWITDLLSRRTEPAVASLLARTSLLVVPMVNPDGYGAHSRYNAASVDLNRNYGFQYRGNEFGAGEHAYSEPEVRAIVLDNEWHRYGVSLSFHTGAENIGYPFNYTIAPSGADERFVGYGAAYKALVSDPEFYVIRGAAWYITYGDTNDYSFGYYGGSDFTVEMSNIKTPPESALARMTAEHGAAASRWVALASETVRIEARDAASGEPLPARVVSAEITAHCDPVTGTAQLQAAVGAVLTVSLPGYVSQTIAAALDAPLVVSLERQTSTPRVRVTSGYAFAGALRIDADVASLVGVRPGADDIRFNCEARLCAAPTYPAQRPGYYALIATFEDGNTVTTPNAFYVEDPSATGPLITASLDGGTVTLSEQVNNAAWVQHGGSAGLLSELVPPPELALDVIYTSNGALYRVPIIAEADETPVAPPTNDDPRGCGGCNTGASAWWGVLAWLAVRFVCRSPRR